MKAQSSLDDRAVHHLNSAFASNYREYNQGEKPQNHNQVKQIS